MPELVRVMIETPFDESPDLSYLEQDYADVRSPVTRNLYRKQDRERLAAYNRGDWHCVGVRVAATVLLGRERGWKVEHTFRSPGVWGVESDAGAAYVRELAADELAILRGMLEDAGNVAALLEGADAQALEFAA